MPPAAVTEQVADHVFNDSKWAGRDGLERGYAQFFRSDISRVQGAQAHDSRRWSTCDVTSAPFSAIGDGIHDDTAAIRSALAQCDSVLLPKRRAFLTAPLNLSSNQVLVVDGTLLASQNISAYPRVAPQLGYGWSVDSNCVPTCIV